MAPGMPTDQKFRHHTANGKLAGASVQGGSVRETHSGFANSIVKIEPLAAAYAWLARAIPTGYASAVNRRNVRGGDTVVVFVAGASTRRAAWPRWSTPLNWCVT